MIYPGHDQAVKNSGNVYSELEKLIKKTLGETKGKEKLDAMKNFKPEPTKEK